MSLKGLIVKWNNDWPWDYVWRKKHGIAFNSEQHSQMTPLDIRLELLEEEMVTAQIQERNKRKEDYEHYQSTGEWWKSYEDIHEDIDRDAEDDLFDSIDLDDFDLNLQGGEED